MVKRWVIYILDRRSDMVADDSLTILQGPGDVWFYSYALDGYDSEEEALDAIASRAKSDEFVVLPVYKN